MKKIEIYIDDDDYEALSYFADKDNKELSEYIKELLFDSFEDILDVVAGDEAYQEFLESSQKTFSLDEIRKELGKK